MRDALLSKEACAYICSLSRADREAYDFAKKLAVLNNHPILLNFKANQAAFCALLKYSDSNFRRLLKLAQTLKYARFEGDHLRLISKSNEKKRVSKKLNYEEIKHEDITNFILRSALEKNVKSQVRAIKFKLSTAKKASGIICDDFHLHAKSINTDATLSVRKAATLWNMPISTAYLLLKGLEPFGLCLHPNRQQISKEAYLYYKSTGKHNARYDKKNAEFYYLGASRVIFSDFYKKGQIKTKGKLCYLSAYLN